VSQFQVAVGQTHSGDFPQVPTGSLASCLSVFRNEIQDIVVNLVRICESNIDMTLTLLQVMLINGTPTDAQR